MKRETKLMHYGRSPKPGPANPPVVRASTILHETVASFRDTNKRRERTILSYHTDEGVRRLHMPLRMPFVI